MAATSAFLGFLLLRYKLQSISIQYKEKLKASQRYISLTKETICHVLLMSIFTFPTPFQIDWPLRGFLATSGDDLVQSIPAVPLCVSQSLTHQACAFNSPFSLYLCFDSPATWNTQQTILQ